MRYYPICLDIQNRNCLVVGGGAVAVRKVKTLLQCNAIVTVISPQAAPELCDLAAAGRISLIKRAYRAKDLTGIFLVIGATDDEILNLQISRDAEARGIIYNIADRPQACNFILPAVVNRGDLIIAISTSGQSPAFAKRLRKELAREFGEEAEQFLKLMGAIRKKLLDQAHEPEAHKALFEQLLDRGLFEMFKSHDHSGIDRLLGEVLGEGFRLGRLGFFID